VERRVSVDPSGAGLPGHAFGLPHTPEEARVVLVPVPFEATTSYGGGASEGPAAVLRASRQVDLFDLETGRPYRDGIAMLPEDARVRAWNAEAKRLAVPIVDAGGAAAGDPSLVRVNALCEEVNRWLEATVGRLIADGKLVATVGGDHGCVYGAIAAHAHAYPGLGILHLDAHADLREAYGGFTWSHASVFHNVISRLPEVSRLVQVGLRDVSEEEMATVERSDGRIVVHPDSALKTRAFDGEPWARQVDRIVQELPEQVYLSFDIDGLDPTLCPHTGTPVPGGLSFPEATALVAGVVRSGRRIVGLDLDEVAPGPDGGEWDGNVGARLLYKMIGWALKSQRGGEGR
jgi:agmatinase